MKSNLLNQTLESLRRLHRQINKNRLVTAQNTQLNALQKSIALAYLDVAYTSPGTEVDVMIRERGVRARVCKTPFV